MKKEEILEFLNSNNYKRVSGSKEELLLAQAIAEKCNKMGVESQIEAFDVNEADIEDCHLFTEIGEIKAKGYRLGGYTSELKAPLYYLRSNDDYSLSNVKGKIVLKTGYFGKWLYNDIVKNGALGIITTSGLQTDNHEDIDNRELRTVVSEGLDRLPCVNINIKDAMRLINENVKEVTISVKGNDYINQSHNVIARIDGETEEKIVLTAHYDSSPLSNGIYDNLSGTVGLLAIMDKFKDTKPHYGLEFVFCGSEERGLLGSRAYVKSHELDNIRLVINLDMIGLTLGESIACCTSEEKLVHYIEYMGYEYGYPLSAYQDVYSSDSTPFADKGIPAVSFARLDPHDMQIIHNRYDTMDNMNMNNLYEDVEFISAFLNRMANAKYLPVKREMPENMKEKLDEYNLRKRPKKK